MPRYLVERPFTDASTSLTIIGEGVTLLHAYVTNDATTSFCLYDAPSAEALRAAVGDDDPPVDVILEVRDHDPSPT